MAPILGDGISTTLATREHHLLALARTALAEVDGDGLWLAACGHAAAALVADWAVQGVSGEAGEWVSRAGSLDPGAVVVDADGRSSRAADVVTVPIGFTGMVLALGWAAPHPLGPDDTKFVADLGQILETGLDRARAEREVAFNAQRLAEAQEMAKLGSYDWNIETDTNLWSDELYRIYGYEPGAFNASYERFLSMIHPEDRDRIVGVHTRAMEDHQPYRMEERVIRPDGEVRILDSSGKVVCDEAGKPIRMIGICLDVTEQRQAAEALRRSEERAAESERQLAHAEERRGQALQINDNVVQGLTSVVYALESGSPSEALGGARATLAAASSMMSELLGVVADTLAPGDLVRHLPAPRHLARRESRPAAPTRPAAPSRGEPQPIRVLIADDSEDLRLLYRVMLNGRGTTVVAEAGDGVEALRLAQEVRPDIVVLDLAMPGLDGLQVTAELKRTLPDCRIVILSGFEESRVGRQSRHAGADRYLQKGVDADTLRSALFELCRQ